MTQLQAWLSVPSFQPSYNSLISPSGACCFKPLTQQPFFLHQRKKKTPNENAFHFLRVPCTDSCTAVTSFFSEVCAVGPHLCFPQCLIRSHTAAAHFLVWLLDCSHKRHSTLLFLKIKQWTPHVPLISRPVSHLRELVVYCSSFLAVLGPLGSRPHATLLLTLPPLPLLP